MQEFKRNFKFSIKSGNEAIVSANTNFYGTLLDEELHNLAFVVYTKSVTKTNGRHFKGVS